MRALFTGRLEVVAGLARACEDAGHDVAFAVPPSSVAAVELAGFEAWPAGLAVEAEAEHAVAALAGDLAPLAARWGAHVLVHDDGALHDGAALGAERDGLPTVIVTARPNSHGTTRTAVAHLATLPPSLQWTAHPERWLAGFAYLRPGPFGARPPDEDVAVGTGDWAFVMAALAAGTPVVMDPRTDEEDELAFRVTAAGAGVLEGPDAVQHLLDEPLYFANAQRLRREIAAMPAAAEAVPAVLAASRSPMR